jgi:hypothetical protein
MNPADAAGWIGAALLLAGYAYHAAGRIARDSLAYRWSNALGSVGLAAVAVSHHSWPSAALNGAWLVTALMTWRRDLRRRPLPNPNTR